MWSYNPLLSKIFGTPLSITQKHYNKTRLAFKKNYFLPIKKTELGKKTISYIKPKIWQKVLPN